MKRFIEGEDRRQATLLPDCLEDYVTDDNPTRVIDCFIEELDLAAAGFSGVVLSISAQMGPQVCMQKGPRAETAGNGSARPAELVGVAEPGRARWGEADLSIRRDF